MITDMVSTGNDVKKDMSQVKNKTNWLNDNNNNNNGPILYKKNCT